MRLHEIKLQNFRQFKGEQSFTLRSPAEKPVSLLFGANGSGKTTFLNAFTWALYGKLSEDVEQQERLVTDSVWRGLPTGDHVEVNVELTFDHEGRSYRLIRRARVRKESDQQQEATPEIRLWVTRADGSSEVIDAPQETILTILPRGVSRFFFFNGERIENLVKKGAYSEVQQDIKMLLDLEQVERALDHLPKAEKRLIQDLKKYGGDKAKAIETAIEGLRERESSTRGQIKVLEVDLAILHEEYEGVIDLLRQDAATAPIQQQRDDVARDLAAARVALEEALAERAHLIATRGFLSFTDLLSSGTSKLAESLYRKGALPAPLKREFVDELLSSGECICGTSLQGRSDARRHVEEWRQRAGLQAVETAWQQLQGQLPQLDAARADLRESLGAVFKRVSSGRERVDRLDDARSELDGKLRDSRREDVQALEGKRIDLEGRRRTKQEQVGALTNELSQVTKEIEQRLRERKSAEVTDELATKARSRAELVGRVQKALQEILEIRSDDMRRRLDAELKEVFRSISHKNYVPTLSASFELTLHTNVDGVELPVPKSTGENQILSLSFVAAVSKLAREIRTERRAEGTAPEDSGTYPIVMDAAFGSLDHDYQESVSRALAQMAPQLVVLVSKSQGLGKVVTELNPYVSHFGVIETHTTLDSVSEDDLELNGFNYPYIRHSAADCSVLKEI